MSARNRHIKIAERVSTRLKLKQLRLLVAIGEHRSVLRAAEQINLSQPAATKLLKDLEIDFGVQLFDRTNRGVIPTESGLSLIRHGKLILAQISHAAQELDDLKEGLGGRIVIGTLLTASAKLLPLTISRVHRARPNISIVVRDGTNDVLMPQLQSGDVDMVVGRLTEYRHREQILQEEFYREKVVIVCRCDHRLANTRSVELPELSEQDWILPPMQTTLRRQLDKEFSDRGINAPSNAVESISYLTIRGLLVQSDMLAVLPYHVVEPEIDRGTLATVNCNLKLSSGAVGVSYRSQDALSPAASDFLKELRAVAGELGG